MNPWDFVTWVSAVLLAGSAVVIFAFFLRDARSILDREMHGHEEEPQEEPKEEPKDSSASEFATGDAAPTPPEDISQ
jgi:hypothetical protein